MNILKALIITRGAKEERVLWIYKVIVCNWNYARLTSVLLPSSRP